MGRAPREKPARLAEKLAQVRSMLDLSQDGMVQRLGLEQRLTREDISKYERGVREPSLLTILRYARAVGVYVDALIDDDVDLPTRLPFREKHVGVKQKKHS